MTTQFYIPPDMIQDDRLALPPDEARHAAKVLRSVPGDEIILVDGAGGWYRVLLDHVDRATVVGHIIERRWDVGEPAYHLTIAAALVKQRGRYEMFLEKAVELGVSRIVPLVTERTERERVREGRSEKILLAAMKQCGRSRLPQLSGPQNLDEFLSSERYDVALCCHEAAGPEHRVLNVLHTLDRPLGHDDSPSREHSRPDTADGNPATSSSMRPRVVALVGPEGGFSDGEVELAERAGYRIVTLGQRRLRAETAAIVVAAAVSLAYDAA